MLIYATFVSKLAMLNLFSFKNKRHAAQTVYFQYFKMKLAGFVSHIFLFHIICTCTSCEPFKLFH